ncbi:MAG: hypothetical protein H3C62_13170 [Gemmatimonadaceae bacterium]|nr:hypothetical protein [Gemmatimonadaceae bacterium]
MPVGTSLPVASLDTRAMRVGDTDHRVTSVLIPRAGYYRVVASVFGASQDEKFVNGQPVVDQVHVERWVYVSDSGGSVTNHFDARLFPDTLQPRPGLLRAKRTRRLRPRLAALSAADEAAVAGGARKSVLDPVARQITYIDYSTQPSPIVRPLAYAPVYQEEFDQYEYRSYGGSWTSTDANGEFTPLCAPVDYYTIRGRVELRGGGIVMDQPYYTGWEEYYGECYQARAPFMETDNASAFVFSQMRGIVAASRAGLPARGDVQVAVRYGINLSAYQYEYDRIEIAGDGPNVATYSDYGAFAQAHEYGHAVHHRALGDYVHGACGPGHNWGTVESFACAYSEGFASFHAAMTGPPARLSSYVGVMQSRSYFQTGVAGLQEVQIAALLLDLVDAANDESHDQVSYPLSYVGAVMASCEAQVDGVWSRAGGDYLAQCFEQGLSTTDRVAYFPTRPVSAFRESATEPANWCKGGVRRVWIWNMGGNLEAPAPCG